MTAPPSTQQTRTLRYLAAPKKQSNEKPYKFVLIWRERLRAKTWPTQKPQKPDDFILHGGRRFEERCKARWAAGGRRLAGGRGGAATDQ